MISSLNLPPLLSDPDFWIIGFWIMIGIFIWGIVDMNYLIRPAGKIKRGVRIWSEPLPPEICDYLRKLAGSMEAGPKASSQARGISFIRVEEEKVLVRCQRPKWRTSWPYVGYIDLTKEEPVVEYRASLPTLLLLLPFIVGIFMYPPLLLLFIAMNGFNYYMERNAIMDYLNRRSGRRRSARKRRV